MRFSADIGGRFHNEMPATKRILKRSPEEGGLIRWRAKVTYGVIKHSNGGVRVRVRPENTKIFRVLG